MRTLTSRRSSALLAAAALLGACGSSSSESVVVTTSEATTTTTAATTTTLSPEEQDQLAFGAVFDEKQALAELAILNDYSTDHYASYADGVVEIGLTSNESVDFDIEEMGRLTLGRVKDLWETPDGAWYDATTGYAPDLMLVITAGGITQQRFCTSDDVLEAAKWTNPVQQRDALGALDNETRLYTEMCEIVRP